MNDQRRLSIDVGRVIAELQAVAKAFELRNKVYRAMFRGRGLEFDGYRDYSPEDDASLIDWKATMRGNRTLIKRYIEERDLKIVFALDVSERMVFGSTAKLKCEYAGEIIAALAHLIMDADDQVGIVLYNDSIVDFIPPKKSYHQFDLIMDRISDASIYKGESNFKVLLDFLIGSVDRSVHSVIVISDFLHCTPELSQDFSILASKYETIAAMVRDPLDRTLPSIDREILIEDPVSKQQLLINPKLYRAEYERNALQQEQMVKDILKRSNIDLLSLDTSAPFFVPLATFLRDRVERKGGII